MNHDLDSFASDLTLTISVKMCSYTRPLTHISTFSHEDD